MKIVVDANDLGTANQVRFEVTNAEMTVLRRAGLDQPYQPYRPFSDSLYASVYSGITLNATRDPEAIRLRDQAMTLQRAAHCLEGVLPRPVELPKLFGVPVKVVG